MLLACLQVLRWRKACLDGQRANQWCRVPSLANKPVPAPPGLRPSANGVRVSANKDMNKAQLVILRTDPSAHQTRCFLADFPCPPIFYW